MAWWRAVEVRVVMRASRAVVTSAARVRRRCSRCIPRLRVWRASTDIIAILCAHALLLRAHRPLHILPLLQDARVEEVLLLTARRITLVRMRRHCRVVSGMCIHGVKGWTAVADRCVADWSLFDVPSEVSIILKTGARLVVAE